MSSLMSSLMSVSVSDSSLDKIDLQHQAGDTEATWWTELFTYLDYMCYWRTPQDGAQKNTEHRRCRCCVWTPDAVTAPTGPALHRLFMCKWHVAQSVLRRLTQPSWVHKHAVNSEHISRIILLWDLFDQRIKRSTVEVTHEADSWFYCFSSNTVKQTPLNITSAESVPQLENRTSIWMIFYVKCRRKFTSFNSFMLN